jgi:hypothetical protein
VKHRKEVQLIFLCIVCGVAVAVLTGCSPKEEMGKAPVQYGPPSDAPTLDYEEMMGLDPLTQQVNEETTRNNDLTWRVDRLERQVRDLNQIVRGVRELRIGEGPTECDNPECDCETCDCESCQCVWKSQKAKESEPE